jgi:hypothetical protein
MNNTILPILIFCLLAHGNIYTMGRVTPAAKLSLAPTGHLIPRTLNNPATSSPIYRNYVARRSLVSSAENINKSLGGYGTWLSNTLERQSNAFKGLAWSLVSPFLSTQYVRRVELEAAQKLHESVKTFLKNFAQNSDDENEKATTLLENELPYDISKVELVRLKFVASNPLSYIRDPSAKMGVLDTFIDYLNNGYNVRSTKNWRYIARIMRTLKQRQAKPSSDGILKAKKVLGLINNKLALSFVDPNEALMYYLLADAILDVYKPTGEEFDSLRKNIKLLKNVLRPLGLHLGSSLDAVKRKCLEGHEHLQITEACEEIMRLLHLTFPAVK